MGILLNTCKLHLQIEPIERDGFHLLVYGIINRKEARFLIDTGASKTVFDMSRIRNFIKASEPFERSPHLSTGLGSNTLESHQALIGTLMLGEAVLKKYTGILIDLSQVNESYEKLGLPPIDGVIGCDLLVHFSAKIDLVCNTIKLHYQG